MGEILGIFGFSFAVVFAITYFRYFQQAFRLIKDLQDTGAEQQRQIDDLKRELEEMKKQAEPQS